MWPNPPPIASQPAMMPSTIASGESALVPYQEGSGADGMYRPSYTAADATNHKHSKGSPRELILHESIRSLVAEVAELRGRCQSLETANATLLNSMDAVKPTYCNEAPRSPLIAANLTGYAPSETGTDVSGDGNHFIRQDNHLEIIEQILVQQNKRIEELSAYKDQSSALFTALKTELNGLDATDFDPDSDSHLVEPQKSAQDVGKAFKMELDCLENTLNIKINGLEEKVGIALALTTGDQEATDGARGAVSRRRNIAKPHGTMGDEEILSFENFLYDYKKRLAYEQKIDDASTKDTLHTMWHQLTDAMFNEHYRGGCGIFHGDFDELFTLRGRVVRRLALFDAVGPAIEEAKRTFVDY